MTDLVLGFALDKISTFLNEQGTLLGGLGQEVQLISDEFGHIKAFLDKMADSNQEKEDPLLTEWIRQVREVSYETEDILDEFVSLSRIRGSIQSALQSLKNVPARHRLATKLQSVKARVKHISEAHVRYESQYASLFSQDSVHAAAAANKAWMLSKDDDALLVGEADLVGIDEPRKLLISQLLDDDVGSQLRAVAVLGMGGLGKTTLVKQVHDDASVKNHFQIRAWIAVSQNCDVGSLLRGLIQQLLAQFKEPIPPQMDSMHSYQLKALLRNILRRGRFVIVFDDVWEMNLWDEFKFVLTQNGYNGNRVVFTTRIADVALASTTECEGYVYEMGFLSFQDSWTLFCKKIFKGKSCPAHLKAVAESIVAKCGGLPLAILAIGGLLASKDSSRVSVWEMIQSRLRDEFEGSGKFDRAKKILSLSYNDLPSALKNCLLFISIYPEGHEIPCFDLMNLLAAQGFVKQKEGQTVEETAWDYLKKLANRSLIQLNEPLYNGLYRYIVIHDLLREFMASKSREQNMATIINTAEQIRTGWPPGNVVRRLVFSHNLLKITSPESHHYSNKCRSIINFGEKKSVSKVVLAKFLTSSLLTVVDLRGMELEEIPKQIFKLFQLNHLGVSGRRIKTVPKSIKRLENLQCFVLSDTNVKELPVEIQNLRKLRHLQLYQQVADSPMGSFPYNGFKAPCGMGELLELQTLNVIDAAKSDEKARIVKELGKLSKLRNLWITNLRREDGEELCSSLEMLHNLSELLVASLVEENEVISLDLNYPISSSSLQCLRLLQLYGCMEKIPPWIGNARGLERITLSWSNLADDPLDTLQHLPNLFELRLTRAFKEESLCFKAGGFLNLKKLMLQNMEGLRRVIFEGGANAMPAIELLQLVQLPSLEALPSGIEQFMHMEKLDLWGLNSQLVDKLDNGEESEDYQKILHIPQVIVGFFIGGKWKGHQLLRKKRDQVKMNNQLTFLP